ncbi:MAG: ABC transporter permease [Tannerella sp.]|jgi:ABC-2 type transport system permease protein|nr:ABC transporter permease [Tannerella sp.]
MKRFAALLHKDFLLLSRDIWGLILLFLMPWALVLLMTYLQDSTFNFVNENRIPLYLHNADKDSLGNMVSQQLMESPIFDVSTGVNGQQLTEKEIEEAVSRGDFMIGVIIPAHSTANLRTSIKQIVEQAFEGESIDNNAMNANLDVKILIDPTTKTSFRATLASAIRENALTIQNKLIFSEVTRQVNQLIPIPVNLNIDTSHLINVQESYAQSEKTKIIPNSVQHNVPAWSMFAIFFIVVSLAGNMIREREIGCYNRLVTMPCSFHTYLFSKITVYLVVCLLQLTLIILTGMLLTPLLGLPALKLGHSISALIGMSVSASLAAIGYGLAIGSVARTNQQASVFGAVSVVILAAVGGVWIPTFIMPYSMQLISRISPLNWGLNGFNDFFVRDSGFVDVLPYITALLLFFAVSIFISYWSNQKRKNN